MSTQKIQRCYVCDAPTGRCEEDSIYLPPKDPNGSDLGPLCEACCDERDPPEPVDKYGNPLSGDRIINCCFPECGCDGARLCMAEKGASSGACALNIERRSFGA